MLCVRTSGGVKTDDSNSKAPKNARWLSTELIRIAPVMRNIGIDIMKKEKREAGTGRRVFILRKMTRIQAVRLSVSKVRTNLFCEASDEADNQRPF